MSIRRAVCMGPLPFIAYNQNALPVPDVLNVIFPDA